MKLTPLEIQLLKLAKKNRHKTLRLRDIFKNNWKKYCILFLCLGILFILSLFLDSSHILPAFIFGAFFGMISRDLGFFRRIIKINPISVAITDWDKVDELLREQEQNNLP